MLKSVFWSTVLRCLSMASKFILIVSFAKLLKPEEVGLFGLMTQTINTCVMLAGMQFFLYSTRSLAGATADRQPAMVRDQAVYTGLLYLVAFPLFLIVFITHMLPWALAPWFYLLVVVEHISYELQRVLASVGQPVNSNVIHTVRTGAWVYILVPLMFIYKPLRQINTVWILWFMASGLSVLMSAWMLRGRGWGNAIKTPVDWTWIKSGIKVVAHYLPVTITLMITALFDRYTLDAYAGKAYVGAYTFYFTIANIVVAFPEAGIATVMSPKIIAEYSFGRMDSFHKMLVLFRNRLLGSIVVTAGAAIIAALLALKFYVREPIYRECLPVFYMLLFSSSLLTLSLWPHQNLYARHHDKPLVIISLVAIIPYIALNLLLVPRFGIFGAASSNIALQVFSLVGKIWLANKVDGPGASFRDIETTA